MVPTTTRSLKLRPLLRRVSRHVHVQCKNTVVAACWALAVFALAHQASAQESWATEHTPTPTIVLAPGTSIPTFNVSNMRIDVGDWQFKPVYEIIEDPESPGEPWQVRVIGFFATTDAENLVGDNFAAVWYLRPAQECDDWEVTTWEGGTAWDAVEQLKADYGIPDFQDDYWEVEVVVTDQAQPVTYNRGFAVGDPMGPIVNNDPNRSQLIEELRAQGHAVAVIPDEDDEGWMKFWLTHTAQFFDATIGRNLHGEDFEEAFLTLYYWPFEPTTELILWCYYEFWRPSPPTCEPRIVYGEWQPSGELCDCTTIGPWAAACGTFKADAEGKVEIHIPWPPPHGTTITIQIGIGGEITGCICLWQRSCTGAAQRTRYRINEDCSTEWLPTETQENRRYTKYFWQIAATPEECQNAAPPSNMPPPDEPCGLEVVQD